MKYFSYLNSATEVIGLYDGKQPLHLFIKDFFKQHKKFGSTDRKQVTQLCYCYFRLGASLKDIPVSEKILTGLFFCSDKNNEILAALKPAWNDRIHFAVEEKCAFLQIPVSILTVFPVPEEVSNAIDVKEFTLSHFIQPGVFLRVRPGCRQTVVNKLEQAHISFSFPGENCIAIANTTKTDDLIDINKEAVIQDYSSQRTGELMQLLKKNNSVLKIWDCCAASGGKSIMAKDIFGNINLTVSDIRETTLINLEKRFHAAGMGKYTTLRADVANDKLNIPPGIFDLIIADVPCTGSGTWGRTPERLTFFNTQEINSYQHLQQKIITAAIPRLKPGGHILYITCSVFTKENEDMVNFIETNFPVELVKKETLKGYDVKADTMFAALIKKRDI